MPKAQEGEGANARLPPLAEPLFISTVQGRSEVQGALGQNIFKITAFEKYCCKSYLNANKMKLQGTNETIINIFEFS